MHARKVSKIALMMPDGALALASEEAGGNKAERFLPKIAHYQPACHNTFQDDQRTRISARPWRSTSRNRPHRSAGSLNDWYKRSRSGRASPRAESGTLFPPEENCREPVDLYLSGLVRRTGAARRRGLKRTSRHFKRSSLPIGMPRRSRRHWRHLDTPAVYAGFIRHLGYSKGRVSHSPVTIRSA